MAAGAGVRPRVGGLEGIRGLAALYVVVNHVFLRAFPGYPVDHAPWWAAGFIYGRFAVVAFIVLSGFSLALSPARDGWQLDGVLPYARRRARRILPPFWAALAFSLAVSWLVLPPPGQAVPDARSVVVNGLFLQNLIAAPSPNRSLWSLAVEAQLYLLFPLLLVMVRRRGAVLMVGAVTLAVAAVGLLAPYIPRLQAFVEQSAPDLAALFAVGILAAGIVRAGGARRSWPWTALGIAALAPVGVIIWWQGSAWTLTHLLWVDLLLGPAIGCLLAALATGRPGRLLRVLDAPPLRGLGLASYSLYLTHGPIVVVVYERLVLPRAGHGPAAFLLALAVVLPLTIGFAWVFAWVFERRVGRQWTSLRGRADARRPPPGSRAGAVSPLARTATTGRSAAAPHPRSG